MPACPSRFSSQFPLNKGGLYHEKKVHLYLYFGYDIDMLYHPNWSIFHGENDLVLCASYYLIGRGSEMMRFLGI